MELLTLANRHANADTTEKQDTCNRECGKHKAIERPARWIAISMFVHWNLADDEGGEYSAGESRS
jgi:hypothetical protein